MPLPEVQNAIPYREPALRTSLSPIKCTPPHTWARQPTFAISQVGTLINIQINTTRYVFKTELARLLLNET